MQFGRYLFKASFIDQGHLPAFKGSAFRGAFGHALRRVCCTARRSDCNGCLLDKSCVYARVFELTPSSPGNDRARIAAPPHPYVIEPPQTDQLQVASGDAFDFALLLFGEANNLLPHFIYAVEEMGRQGLGASKNRSRLGFRLESVSVGDTSIYPGAESRLQEGPWTTDLHLSTTPSAAEGNLTVILRTPLRLKQANSYQAELPFHLLVRAMLRRISTLHEYFGEGEPALDYRGLVARAQTIVTQSSTISWLDVKRYSSRQEQAMLIGGMLGSATYSKVPAEYLPLLEFCRQVHLGKQTTFGLGQIDYTFKEAP